MTPDLKWKGLNSCLLMFNKKCLLFPAFLLVAGQAFGQAARSPFSSFGLGEQYGLASAVDQGMGGVGISNMHYWNINNQNAALLVHNRYTSFQAGMIGEQRTQVSTLASERSGSGNLNYVTIAIPVVNGKWTTSFNLMPYTKLNYRLTYRQQVAGDTAHVQVTEEGSGGINQFGWSNGVKINKWASVGLRSTYLFSSVSNLYSNEIQASGQVLVITPYVYERTFVSSLKFSPSVSIHIDSITRKNYRLNFGLVYDMAANLNSKFYQRTERHNLAGIIDSLTLIRNVPGKVSMPSTLSVGISFAKSYTWIAAIDGSFTNYSSYKDISGLNPYSGTNSWRLAAGFELIPDGGSFSNYFKRVAYRTGVSLENYPYLVNGNTVKDFGITFGLSLPVGRISSLDLALKVGKKGDKALNTVEENYIKLYFGLTFNDQWFIKRRFD